MTRLRQLLASLALLGFAHGAWAGSGFGVSPLRLDLSAPRPMAAFTLTNSGDVPVVIQAQPRAWRQVDGVDVSEPTRALLVNPAIVSLEPGQSQMVRVALRAAPDRRLESGYRMFFTEVPQTGDAASAEKPQTTNIRIVKRMDVPVFVAPVEGEPKPDGRIGAQTKADSLRLDFENSGTGHWRLGELRVFDAASGEALANPTVVSVLPGGARHIELLLRGRPAPDAIVVKADVNGEEFRTRLDLRRAQ